MLMRLGSLTGPMMVACHLHHSVSHPSFRFTRSSSSSDQAGWDAGPLTCTCHLPSVPLNRTKGDPCRGRRVPIGATVQATLACQNDRTHCIQHTRWLPTLLILFKAIATGLAKWGVWSSGHLDPMQCSSRSEGFAAECRRGKIDEILSGQASERAEACLLCYIVYFGFPAHFAVLPYACLGILCRHLVYHRLPPRPYTNPLYRRFKEIFYKVDIVSAFRRQLVV